MVELKITHTIVNIEDLRALCIESEWFDRATIHEYDKFLNYAGKPAEPSVLLDMANQVYDHTSDYRHSEDRKEGLASIVWTLYRLGVDHTATIL